MDSNKIAAIKAALLQTTSTTGWQVVKTFANKIAQNMAQEALDEEDPVKGESKRLKASAIQRGFRDLFAAIETTQGLDLESDDAGMGEIT